MLVLENNQSDVKPFLLRKKGADNHVLAGASGRKLCAKVRNYCVEI